MEKQSKSTKPLAPYIGGKRNLAGRIIERISAIPHEQYAEPFVGMGGVFLRRPTPAKREIINDLNRDVATFFRILQRHYVAFLDMLRWQLTTRSEFERLLKVDPETLTDLERSARFLYLQRLTFGGKVAGRTFGASPGNQARFDLTKLVPMLEAAHERLTPVVIECLPWRTFLERYDRKDALFYLDPPYWGSEKDYGRGLFGREDFAELAEVLAGIKGRFLLSINDVPAIRETFARFSMEELKTTYTVRGGSHAIAAAELLISNG